MKNSGIFKKDFILFVLVILLISSLYLFPAIRNDYLKGSDSWFHLRRSSELMEGNFFYDNFSAGGHESFYPPLFHIILIPLHFLGGVWIFKFVGPVIMIISAIGFYIFLNTRYNSKKSILATLIYSITIQIVDISIFSLYPQALAIMLIPFMLYFNEKKKYLYLSAILLAMTLVNIMSFLVSLGILLIFAKNRITEIWKYILPSLFAFIGISLFSLSLRLVNNFILSYSSLYFFIERIQPAFIVFFVIGIVYSIKTKKNFEFILWSFLTIFYFFLIPLYPERILNYLIFPFSIIAADGFLFGFEKLKKNKKIIWSVLVIVFLSIGFYNSLVWSYLSFPEITKNDVEILRWANENIPNNSVIASSWQVSGPWIPYFSERKNVLGAYQESIGDYLERREALSKILGSKYKIEIEEYCEIYNVTHIFVNKAEDRIIYPGAIDRMKKFFAIERNNEYAYLFRVV